jgi:hypothetical protein
LIEFKFNNKFCTVVALSSGRILPVFSPKKDNEKAPCD